MEISGWILSLLVVILVVLLIIGQPRDDNILTWEISPDVLTRGYNKTLSASRAFITIIGDEQMTGITKNIKKKYPPIH